MILLRRVVGKGFDNHPGAIRLERRQHVLRCSRRITHVMQAIEKRNQVVTAVDRVALRTGNLEADLIEKAIASCHMACVLNRPAVIIKPAEARLRKRLRHQHRRSTVSATNVGYRGTLGKFLSYSIES